MRQALAAPRIAFRLGASALLDHSELISPRLWCANECLRLKHSELKTSIETRPQFAMKCFEVPSDASHALRGSDLFLVILLFLVLC